MKFKLLDCIRHCEVKIPWEMTNQLDSLIKHLKKNNVDYKILEGVSVYHVDIY